MKPGLLKDFVGVYDNVASPDLCRRIIDKFESCGLATPGRVGDGYDPTKKVSSDISINCFPEWQQVGQELYSVVTAPTLDYMSQLVFPLTEGLSVLNTPNGQIPVDYDHKEQLLPYAKELFNSKYYFGITNIQKYDANAGGYFKWHSEIYPSVTQPLQLLYRAYFWILYLNDVTEGGETELYYQNQLVEPRTGRFVIAPAGITHTHRGRMPKSSDKYIAASWIMWIPR